MHQVDLEGVQGPRDYVVLSIYFSNPCREGQKMHIIIIVLIHVNSLLKLLIHVNSIITHIGIA